MTVHVHFANAVYKMSNNSPWEMIDKYVNTFFLNPAKLVVL